MYCFSLQFDLLAELLQDGGLASRSSPTGPSPDVGLVGSAQQHTTPTSPTMVGDGQFQLEPNKELTSAYSDTLPTTYTSTFTGNDVLHSSGECGDTNLMNFMAEANFNDDVLYPCNELSISEADLENWDLSSLLAAV